MNDKPTWRQSKRAEHDRHPVAPLPQEVAHQKEVVTKSPNTSASDSKSTEEGGDGFLEYCEQNYAEAHQESDDTRHAIEQYELLISIMSDIAVVKDVDWEQDEHIAAAKTLRAAMGLSTQVTKSEGGSGIESEMQSSGPFGKSIEWANRRTK